MGSHERMYVCTSLSARPLSPSSGIWRVPRSRSLCRSPLRSARGASPQLFSSCGRRRSCCCDPRQILRIYPELLLLLALPPFLDRSFFEQRSRDLVCPISALLFALRSRKTEQVATTEKLPPLIRQSVYASSLLKCIFDSEKSQIVPARPESTEYRVGLREECYRGILLLFLATEKKFLISKT